MTINQTGRLAGKVAFVGGSGGKMGRAVPLLFAQEGAKVMIAARSADTTAETVQRIRDAGGEAESWSGDLTDEAQAAAGMAATVQRFGSLDILYCNAGGFAPHTADVENMDSAFWDQATRNNLRSTFLQAKHAIPHFRTRGGGAIITVAAAPMTRQRGNAAYATAKSGIIGFTRNLAREVRQHNIRVNCIAPGFMRGTLAEGKVQPAVANLTRTGMPEDAAFAALYLASDEAGWITGQVLSIDGGDDVAADLLYDR